MELSERKNEIIGLGEKLLTKLLDKGVDSVAILIDSHISRQVRFAVNQIVATKTWDETNIGVMIDKDKKVVVFEIGLASLSDIDEISNQLMMYIKNVPPREDYAPLPEPSMKYPGLKDNWDENILKNPEMHVNLAFDVIDSGKKAGAKRMAGTLLSKAMFLCLITSNGSKLTQESTQVYLDVRAFMDKESTGHASIAGTKLSQINASKVAEEAASTAKLSQKYQTIDPGRYDTFFTYDATAALLNLIGGATSAFAVETGQSFFIKKLHTSVAPEIVNLKDDPLFPGAYNSRAFDDEGSPTRANELIVSGELKTYLHNRFTAKKFGSELTGNAGWISPRAWNLVLEPGDQSINEMIENIRNGLVIHNVTYIRFQNYMAGDFSGIIRDGVFLVKNGEITAAVRGLRLSDNTLRMLSNIIAVGKERRQIFHWWLERDIPVLTAPIIVKDVNYTKAVK